MLKYKKLADASYKKEQRQKEVPSFSFQLFCHPTGKLGAYLGDTITHPMLITFFAQI